MKSPKKKSELFSVHGDASLTAHLKPQLVEKCPVQHALEREHDFLKKRGWQTPDEPHADIVRTWFRRVRDPKGDARLKTYGLKGPAYKIETNDKMDQEEELSAYIADFAEKALLAANRGDHKMMLHFAYLAGRNVGIAHVAWRDRTKRSRAHAVKGMTTPERIREAHTLWLAKGGIGKFDAQVLMKIDPYFINKYESESLRVKISKTLRRNSH